MKDISKYIYNIRRFDEIGEKDTAIHKLNSSIKVLVTLFYIIKVLSIKSFNLWDIGIVVLYPLLIFILGKIPFMFIARKLIIVIPLILGIVVVNIIIDPTLHQIIKSSLLLLKAILTVFGTLLLISTTSMNNIAAALRKLKVPKIFVIELMMIYRYLIFMLEEILNIRKAYTFRSNSEKGIEIKDFSIIIGRMLLKSIDRGENVYLAMKARGFDGEYYIDSDKKISRIDIVYFVSWTISFIIL